MDTFTISNFTGLTQNGAASTGSTLNTGDLRRNYNFGSMVSELNIAQDPFFRMLSLYRKESTDDSQFKFTEKRQSFHKRYGYVVAHSTDGSSYTTGDATVAAAAVTAGESWWVKMKADYKSAGNITSRFGNVNNKIDVGDSGTRPQHFLPNQLIKINTGGAYNVPNDYILGRITEVTNSTDEDVILKLSIVKAPSSSYLELQWSSAAAPVTTVYNVANANIIDNLESKRSYIVGNAFAKGSGYPDTWADNPYSTGYGQTQIWKTALGMDNTTRAHQLKYEQNEWARIWGEKLIEHKWDIETDLLFGTQYTDAEGIQYTQGAVDYTAQYGNLFSLDHDTKTCDDFLDDLSQFTDPRYGNNKSTMYMCDTYTYNWLNKMSGYFANNIQITPNYRADFSFKGRGNIGGVETSVISTNYGDLNLVRNVHLDGTGVHILGLNLNFIKYRPLVGNGLNRDTSVYVGVQTLENSGVDKRVDLILTEAGMEFSMPERHAMWK